MACEGVVGSPAQLQVRHAPFSFRLTVLQHPVPAQQRTQLGRLTSFPGRLRTSGPNSQLPGLGSLKYCHSRLACLRRHGSLHLTLAKRPRAMKHESLEKTVLQHRTAPC